jgi:hypothetical protein
LSSTLAEAFTHDKSVKPWRTVCPRCAANARLVIAIRERKSAWIWCGVIGMIAATEDVPWLAANMLLCVPVSLLATIWHELGHVFVARLLGFEVSRVMLGLGPKRFERRWLGVRWDVRRHLAGGLTFAATRDPRSRVLRASALTVAGPLANLLLAVAGTWLLLSTSYGEDPFAELAPVGVVVLVNGLLGIANLVPFTTGGSQPSDGKLILLGAWKPEEMHRRYREADYISQYLELRRTGRTREALALAVAAAAEHPDSPALSALPGVAYLDERQIDAARQSFDAALERFADTPAVHVLRNNVAFVALLVGSPDDLERGAALSAQAYAALPWEPAVAGTQAAYRLLDERPADAIAAIEQIRDVEMEDADRKTTLGTLALALERAGNIERAAAVRCEAEALEGDGANAATLARLFATRCGASAQPPQAG